MVVITGTLGQKASVEPVENTFHSESMRSSDR